MHKEQPSKSIMMCGPRRLCGLCLEAAEQDDRRGRRGRWQNDSQL